jgi:hypothetical protein
MAMPLRFSVLKSVAEIRIDDLDALDELDELIAKAEDAGNRRNAIAHHSWCHDPKTGEIFTVKETARSSYSMDLIPMTIDKVESDAEFIYEVGMEFMAFMKFNNIRPPIPPSRNRFHKTKPERKSAATLAGLSINFDSRLVAAIDQQPAHAGGARFAEGDFLRAVHQEPFPEALVYACAARQAVTIIFDQRASVTLPLGLNPG